ncbi:hypothetical protein OL548_26730 [Lysinibacillus sp. MHQ-1]|nr:hypothetical protein OL548_26730 [Lysinibacillus sp. MHQ-1]
MPQKGARAQLHFPSAVEEDAIVISSVRVNPATPEGGQKQTKKNGRHDREIISDQRGKRYDIRCWGYYL